MTLLGTGESSVIEAFGRQIELSRIVGRYGSGGGPTIVVIAGLHGNEPAGVVALHELIGQLKMKRPECRGQIIGLAGNLAALSQARRFIHSDLNRLWLPDLIKKLSEQGSNNSHEPCAEHSELRELHSQIVQILRTEQGPFYFIDLHTTSSVSPPFIPFDDTLTNRKFVQNFPVPCVLGIEEFLPGTLLSYLVRFGVVTFGYEAGKHEDPRSVDFHRAILVLAMLQTGMLNRESFPEAQACEQLLREGCRGTSGFYEIRYRYSIRPGERFQMLPGFESFHAVRKKQQLATNLHGVIQAEQSGQIFMPLYQSQGEDGFFLIRRVPRVWLEISKNLRQWRLERVISRLPGVQSLNHDSSTLLVNPSTARFLSRQVFHLLGYRRTDSSGSQIRFTKRDA